MSTAIPNPRHKPVVLGVSLSKSDDHLIQSAAALALKLESPLELVHATQPIFNYMGAGDVVVNPYYGYDRIINDMEDDEARQALDKIRRRLPQNLRVGLHVVRDYTSEALTTIATEVRAGLIMLGIGRGTDNNLFEGVSTTFSLAAHADVPVLIAPLDAPIPFAESPRMLVADNLQAEGNMALEGAIQMAVELNCAEICHVHVHRLSSGEVQHMVDKVREAMNLGKIPLNPDFSTSSYTDEIRRRIEEELQRRFRAVPGAQAVASHYQALVKFGQPAEELHRATSIHKPQLLVFGRHHLFHRQHLSLGKIPYNAMMVEGVATLIVPDTMADGRS